MRRAENRLRLMQRVEAASLDEPRNGLDSELIALAERAGHAAPPAEQVPRLPRTRDWLLRRALVAADVLGCAAALLLVQFAVVKRNGSDGDIDALMVGALAGWVVIAQNLGLYECRSAFGTRSTADDFPAI